LCKKLLELVATPPDSPVKVDDNAGPLSESKVELIRSRPWLLDAGCGSASFSAAARLLGTPYNILAYDKDEEVLKIAKERLAGPLPQLQTAMEEECLSGPEVREHRAKNKRQRQGKNACIYVLKNYFSCFHCFVYYFVYYFAAINWF
jgi:SAM-dependent methyltransferase